MAWDSPNFNPLLSSVRPGTCASTIDRAGPAPSTRLLDGVTLVARLTVRVDLEIRLRLLLAGEVHQL